MNNKQRIALLLSALLLLTFSACGGKKNASDSETQKKTDAVQQTESTAAPFSSETQLPSNNSGIDNESQVSTPSAAGQQTPSEAPGSTAASGAPNPPAQSTAPGTSAYSPSDATVNPADTGFNLPEI